ncbi:hypothetical protein BGX38DRAFT_828377 [Terfezia claveryi]|nr:hypothetical protein BGX38DRAFT_435572 [Terfezia claveryi]KAF8440677.1 hypothetical protein BGX38DRAFT_828377 [Terfezia claveryi]
MTLAKTSQPHPAHIAREVYSTSIFAPSSPWGSFQTLLFNVARTNLTMPHAHGWAAIAASEDLVLKHEGTQMTGISPGNNTQGNKTVVIGLPTPTALYLKKVHLHFKSTQAVVDKVEIYYGQQRVWASEGNLQQNATFELDAATNAGRGSRGIGVAFVINFLNPNASITLQSVGLTYV